GHQQLDRGREHVHALLGPLGQLAHLLRAHALLGRLLRLRPLFRGGLPLGQLQELLAADDAHLALGAGLAQAGPVVRVELAAWPQPRIVGHEVGLFAVAHSRLRAATMVSRSDSAAAAGYQSRPRPYTSRARSALTLPSRTSR